MSRRRLPDIDGLVLGGLLAFFRALCRVIWRAWAGRPSSSHSPHREPIGHIQGNGSYSIEVVGESFYTAALRRIVGNELQSDGVRLEVLATIVPEDDNPHDDQAVCILVNGERVGHLARAMARTYRSRLQEQSLPRAVLTCKALIVGGFTKEDGSRANFGVYLDL